MSNSILRAFAQGAPCIKTKNHFLLLSTFLLSTAAIAQPVPDAGSILREQNQSAPDVVAPPQPAIEMPQADAAVDEGPTLVVQGFAFSGNTLISSGDLQAQLTELVGEELSLGQLQTVGLILTGYYATEGYLARFVLPPQDVQNGMVRFEVIEGLRGDIQISQQGQRIDSERVRAFIEARTQAGQVINMNLLGEALNILNEQPGVVVISSLRPGANEREIDLNVTASDTPLVRYSLSADNYSTRAAGQNQISLGVGISNLGGNFDLLTLGLNKSEGSTSGNLGYSLAIGDRGLRFSVDASALDYELVQSEFATLQAEGDARTLGVGLSYPLSRQTLRGGDVTARLEQRQLEDNTVSGQTGDRTVRVLNLGWNSYQFLTEGWYQGLISSSLTLELGKSDQKNAAALAADAATRDTNGNFAKIDFTVSHMRSLDETWSLVSALSGQLTNTNLDSSARFSLGGSSGVRGFPLSEATGDEGYILSFDLSRPLGDQAKAGAFFDYGRIHVNEADFVSGSTIPNWYSLSSAGVNLDWQFGQNISFSATLAQPLSNNPGANAQGEDSDGRERGTRVWLSLSAYF